ncbi:MAG: hypothetical protein GC193_05040 [Cryomorphaceae bacterium]|nr:hypothetical protein [Cryomorphaceae bacterium]
MRTNHLIGIAIIALLFSSCKDKKEDETQTESFATLLIRTEADLIAPALSDFESAAAQFADAAAIFDVSTTAQNLTQVQEAFIDAYVAWQKVSQFRYGPATEFDILGKMNTFPTDYIQIENAIQSGLTSGLPNATKGLPAIDYLLFHQPNDEILAQLFDQSRKNYLLARITEVSTLATQYKTAWANGYKSTFVNADGPSVTGGLSLLANGLIEDYEQLKREKVALPLGLLTLGIELPEKVEGYYSQQSMTLILAQLDGVQNLFNNGDSYGLDDLLDARDAWHSPSNMLLSERINQQLDEARVALAFIISPLSEAIGTDPEIVENAYNELQQVVVLLKTDMISALGVSVTSTDNDGD